MEPLIRHYKEHHPHPITPSVSQSGMARVSLPPPPILSSPRLLLILQARADAGRQDGRFVRTCELILRPVSASILYGIGVVGRRLPMYEPMLACDPPEFATLSTPCCYRTVMCVRRKCWPNVDDRITFCIPTRIGSP